MKRALKVFGVALAILSGIVFFWLFPLKLISRLLKRSGTAAPCPNSLSWLVDNPIRRRYQRSTLDRVGIQPGDQVLELGPGPGTFTVEAGHRAGPSGRLIAVDIQPEMIAQVDDRVRQAGLINVETHVAGAYDLPLGDETVDRAFLVTVLPEIPDQARALDELRRVLKPGGVLSITEEFFDPDYPFPWETLQRLKGAGFEEDACFGNLWVYTMNFRKPGGEME